jgi:predicted helicase
MPENGKTLEKLIASLEKVLANRGDIVIEAPKRMPDRTTGSLREHDVVLTTTHGHHSFTIAIECRDHSRPITVNQVEGFWAKCQDTRIDQGIIVSSAGFYNTARKKAEHLGIRCLDIEEVESFDWLLAPGIRSITKKIVDIDWTFHPETTGIVDSSNFEMLDANGNIVRCRHFAHALSRISLILERI